VARPQRWLPVYRGLWWAVSGSVGAIGLAGGCVFLGGFAAACLAGVGAVLGAAAVPWRPRTPAAGRSPVAAALLAAAGPLAVIGLAAELGLPALALVGLLAAGWWPLRRPPARPRRRVHRVAPAPPALETVPPDPLPAPAALPQLSLAELCRVWRVTSVRLQRCTWSGELEHVAALRRGCLDELQRRDPATFARWITTARAAGDPARLFLREQRQA
jgi:hypothetical protein